MRVVKYLVLLLVVLGFLHSANAEYGAPNGWGVNWGVSYDGFRVNHLPESIRNVPIHPSDGGVPGPISEEAYSALIGAEMGLGYIGSGSLGSKWRYRLGGGIKWLLFPAGPGADTEERNYTNNPGSDDRGEGAALTYLSVGRYGPIPSVGPVADLFLAWTPEAKFEVGPISGPLRNILLGASVSYCTWRVNTGWDRYDSKEQRSSETLAHGIPTRLYMSFRNPNSQWGFNIGAQLNPRIDTDLGKKSDIEQPLVSGFLSFGYRF